MDTAVAEPTLACALAVEERAAVAGARSQACRAGRAGEAPRGPLVSFGLAGALVSASSRARF